jgi:hypothetical protein
MSDDKKIIFSMSGLSKTFSGESKPVLKKYLFKFFLWCQNWYSWFKWLR